MNRDLLQKAIDTLPGELGEMRLMTDKRLCCVAGHMLRTAGVPDEDLLGRCYSVGNSDEPFWLVLSRFYELSTDDVLALSKENDLVEPATDNALRSQVMRTALQKLLDSE